MASLSENIPSVIITTENVFWGLSSLQIQAFTGFANAVSALTSLAIVYLTLKSIKDLRSSQKDQYDRKKSDAAYQLVFDIHREFSAMLPLRNLLYEKLAMREGIIRDGDPQELEFWQLVAFYQRLAIAIRKNLVDGETANELMGYLALWWYYIHFKEKFGDQDFGAIHDVRELVGYIEKITPQSQLELRMEKINVYKCKIDGARKALSNKS